MTIECPLCLNTQCEHYYSSTRKNLIRDYLICRGCDLIFVPEKFHLSVEEQKERYLQHNNDPDDEQYRIFLSRLKDRLIPFLAPGQFGLDYGCGPGPTLSLMMSEDGHETNNYDPIFRPDPSVLDRNYEFIVSTETIEHFSDVKTNFDLINRILKVSGFFGVMTSVRYENIDFGSWHYRYDPTHLSFYSPETMQYIASNWGWTIVGVYENVYIFRKE